MRLSKEQRAELFAGRAPDIHVGRVDGKWSVQVGQVVRLSRKLAIEVLRVDPQKGGRGKVRYVVHDFRDPPRLLRRTPPVVVPEADGAATPDSISRAAGESSYTGSPAGAITDAGEAVDERSQDRFSRESQQERVRRMADYERRKRERPLIEQLAEALEEAREAGVDTGRQEARIEAGIEALRRRTRREAA